MLYLHTPDHEIRLLLENDYEAEGLLKRELFAMYDLNTRITIKDSEGNVVDELTLEDIFSNDIK